MLRNSEHPTKPTKHTFHGSCSVPRHKPTRTFQRYRSRQHCKSPRTNRSYRRPSTISPHTSLRSSSLQTGKQVGSSCRYPKHTKTHPRRTSHKLHSEPSSKPVPRTIRHSLSCSLRRRECIDRLDIGFRKDRKLRKRRSGSPEKKAGDLDMKRRFDRGFETHIRR